MDIVICIALKDILFLNKNIFFIQKNINPGHIYIITDKRNKNATAHWVRWLFCMQMQNSAHNEVKTLFGGIHETF